MGGDAEPRGGWASAQLPLPEAATAPRDRTGQVHGDPAGSAGAEREVGTRSAQQRNNCSMKTLSSWLPRPRRGAASAPVPPDPRPARRWETGAWPPGEGAPTARSHQRLDRKFSQRKLCELSEAYSLYTFREVSRIRVKLLTKHEQVPVMILLQCTCFNFVPS